MRSRLLLVSVILGSLASEAAYASSTAIYEFSDRYEVIFYRGCPEIQAWKCGLLAIGCRKKDDSWRTVRAFVHRLGSSDVARWLMDGATTSVWIDSRKAHLRPDAIEPSEAEKLWTIVYEPVELLQWMPTAAELRLQLGRREVAFVLDAMDRQNVGKLIGTCFSPGAAGLASDEEFRHLFDFDRDRQGKPSLLEELSR